MRVIDPGHWYEIQALDRAAPSMLRFVKRVGAGYPGNAGEPYPGVNCQEALRAIHDRAGYLNGQFWCVETWLIHVLAGWSIWLFELRAARIKRRLPPSRKRAIAGPQCGRCGHVHGGECE